MDIMRNFTKIGIVAVLILVTGGFVVKDKIKESTDPKVLTEDLKKETQILPSSTPMPSQVVSITPNKIQDPSYSIEIKTHPTLNSYGFTYTATLKNILVTPYITNFGFFECNFSDGNGDKYSGTIYDQNTFEKAIFPKESREFTAKDLNIGISGLDNTTEGLQKCSYNEKGEKVCELINNLKIIDCMGYISTNGRSVEHGSGGLKIIFPTL